MDKDPDQNMDFELYRNLVGNDFWNPLPPGPGGQQRPAHDARRRTPGCCGPAAARTWRRRSHSFPRVVTLDHVTAVPAASADPQVVAEAARQQAEREFEA
jgi:hypothetical protein